MSRKSRKREIDKGVKIFSKGQLKRDLEMAILNILYEVIEIRNQNRQTPITDIIHDIIRDVVMLTLEDITMIFIFDKLFGSHKNWDWLHKVVRYITRVVVLSKIIEREVLGIKD